MRARERDCRPEKPRRRDQGCERDSSCYNRGWTQRGKVSSVFERAVHQVRVCECVCCGCECERSRTDEAGIGAIPSQRGRKRERELGGKPSQHRRCAGFTRSARVCRPVTRTGEREPPQRGVSLLPVELRVRVSPRLAPYKFGGEKSQ